MLFKVTHTDGTLSHLMACNAARAGSVAKQRTGLEVARVETFNAQAERDAVLRAAMQRVVKARTFEQVQTEIATMQKQLITINLTECAPDVYHQIAISR